MLKDKTFLLLIILIFFRSAELKAGGAINNAEKKASANTATEQTTKTPMLSFHFSVTTPTNILPFTGLSVGSYFRNKFNFGLGAGVSGPYLAAGFHYLQAHIYGNINLNDKLYFGLKFGYRAMINFASIKSKDYQKEAPEYFEGITGSTNSAVISTPIYVGYYLTDSQSLELGVDVQFRLYKYNSFNYDALSAEARNSPANQRTIDSDMNSIETYFNTFEKLSWVYLAWRLRL